MEINLNYLMMIQAEYDNSIQTYTKNFADNTTTHGPKNIFAATRVWAKLLWATLFFTSFTVFLWQGVSLIMEYFEYPVATSIHILHHSIATFPAVTICNQNRIKESLIYQKDTTSFGNIIIWYNFSTALLAVSKLNNLS